MVRMSYHLGAFRDTPQCVDGVLLAVPLENKDAWAFWIVRIVQTACPTYRATPCKPRRWYATTATCRSPSGWLLGGCVASG